MHSTSTETPCAGCGATFVGGEAGCRALFDRLLERDFSDARFFRVHRTMVDAYCLQHPAVFCVSAKSLAAHLCGLAEAFAHGGARATGPRSLQRWLNGNPGLTKPELPSSRGTSTIASVAGLTDPRLHAAAVEQWARSVWQAYEPLHALAHEWLRLSSGQR